MILKNIFYYFEKKGEKEMFDFIRKRKYLFLKERKKIESNKKEVNKGKLGNKKIKINK